PQRSFGDRDRGFRDRDDRGPRREGGGFGGRYGSRDRDAESRPSGERFQRGDDRGGRPFRDRDGEGGFRDRPGRPAGEREDRGGARPFSREGFSGGSRTRYEQENEPKEREKLPELAPDITPDELDSEARDELRSLPNDLANLVASHLVAAARALSEEEPERAYEHAKVARRFAGRIGVVREAAGIAAYHAGQYAEALGDLRAARRLTGSDEYLPVMADCERGLGRPERALDLVRSREAERLDRGGKIELAIVESGARRDLGQHDAAVITLQRVPELRDPQPKPWSARLAFAYADALADAGHQAAATDWFAKAMAFDEEGETDAAERYAELTGGVIEDAEEDFDELDEAGQAAEEALAGEGDEVVADLATEGEGDSADADADAEPASAAPEPSAEPTVEKDDAPSDAVTSDAVTSDAADDQAGKGDAGALGPAFIEPDFGDVLDGPDDRDKPAS
ncbi:FUSC family protein, partial [Microtetraspora niveoalba]|uniref:FUSC family protein n=1 Tax=Microtetraspora niveoalba TaxID=46175 RepID=UPI000A935C34